MKGMNQSPRGSAIPPRETLGEADFYYPLIIAIDPDVETNGLALLYNRRDAQGKLVSELELYTLSFAQLWHLLHEKGLGDIDISSYRWADEILLCVEAGWKHSAHWHIKAGESHRTAARKGNSVGRNHETGRKLIELIEYDSQREAVERQIELVNPFRKVWRGAEGKISHEEFVRLTGWRGKGRTNQEERDAGLIAWTFREVPRRIPKG